MFDSWLLKANLECPIRFFVNFSMTLKGNAAHLNFFILWMKTMHYPNTIRSHLVTIVLMAPFTPKSTLKL